MVQTSMWQSGLRRGVLPWAMVADAIITQISTPRGGAYRSGVRGVRCDALQQIRGLCRWLPEADVRR
ncbi:hypothetical protein JCM18916_2163 [Cutibacterium acnes JCM 18916]|nr:hypothetical protein HMPREF9567_00495 [Cutibacterium acnes HL013PA1]EFS59089.1 hypothetical protein HMPREF9604_00697 [Cutibacterium acnes HL036PA1]EFT60146.1 hypothetical protein HMPREF9572_01831 [Cutibacterium acnes HL072PA1]EFT68975.1 hypothetical protein HMPREF9583_00690 [Cutibacterium acnes HL038PA1]EGF69786.1 hypothetical protein HMPREF9579_00658 [Cutibacterium acnes HL087PA1]GAE72709.1 hypothetical protein JCM18916_2163 [Cutibacterium acnes JCM 18916]